MRLMILLVFVCSCVFAQASTILASTFGYNTTNATAAFQAAVQSPNDTIIIDLQADDWNVGPSLFFDLTDKTLIFQPGVVLRALPGAFPGTGDCLMKLVRCHNINIIGYGVEFIMNKPEYVLLNDSEYRHTLHIENGLDITVKGLTLRDSGGDGIYVGGADFWGEPRTYSENIVLEDLRSINQYRQGMSITSVQGMRVRHCLFTETNGTLPEDGVDIEPYATYQRIVDLQFDKCSFTRNDHAGIHVALFSLDNTSLPVSIVFNDCRISHNGRPGHPYGPVEIDVSNDVDVIPGSLTFNRCHVDSSDWTAVVVRKPAASFPTVFNDCAFTNVSQQQVNYNTPIWVEVTNYVTPCAPFGGVAFNDCLITYDTDFPYLHCNGWTTSPGPEDVSFTGTVREPNGNAIVITNSTDTINCAFNANNVNAMPPTTMEHAFLNNTAEECGPLPAVFQATRTSADVSFPLPFSYLTGGAVTYADDVHLMTGSLMIPSGAPTNTDSITPRWDDITESPEFVAVQTWYSNLYTLPQFVSYSANVFDCLGTAVEENEEHAIVAWPNPFTETFAIRGLAPSATVTVLDALGRTVYSGKMSSELGRGWNAGAYTVIVQDGSTREALILVKTCDH